MADGDITLAILLEHMQGMKVELLAAIQKVDSKFSKRMDGLERRFDGVDRKLGVMNVALDNIDKRLDGIETTIIEQRHEERIVRLEEHAGLAPIA